MQVMVEEVSSVKRVLHVEIPENRVTSELDKMYGDLKKKAKVKGFRPGNVPRSILKRMYHKEVHADVTAKLIKETFGEALETIDAAIVGDPHIDPSTLVENEPYRYDAIVEIKPVIADIHFKGLKLKKPVYTIKDEIVEEHLKLFARQMTKLIPLPEARPLAMGDIAVIDYEGFYAGKPFPETQKTKNYGLKIGAGAISQEFDEKMTGMQPGESREIEVTFAQDYVNTNLAGKTIGFHVELHEIRMEQVPAIDDELARNANFESLEAFRRVIEDNLRQGYAKRSEQELNEQIFQALLGQVQFEIPESLIQHELANIIADTERLYGDRNLTPEQMKQIHEMLAEKYRDTADKQARRFLILNKLIEQENLTLSDAALEKGFADAAAAYKMTVDQIKERFGQSLEGFKYGLLEKDAIKLIMDHSEIEEQILEPGAALKDDSASPETEQQD